MSTEAEIHALATCYLDSAERGDIPAHAECYAPDATIWHNVDEKEQTRDTNIEASREFFRIIGQRVFAERRIHVFSGGFVHQHELQGVRADGVRVVMPICIVCQVKDGRITRREEYFDSARLAQFL